MPSSFTYCPKKEDQPQLVSLIISRQHQKKHRKHSRKAVTLTIKELKITTILIINRKKSKQKEKDKKQELPTWPSYSGNYTYEELQTIHVKQSTEIEHLEQLIAQQKKIRDAAITTLIKASRDEI